MKLKPTLVLVVAIVGGAGVFAWRASRASDGSAGREPELRWLKREFALDDRTMRRIAELHRRYLIVCEPTCAELQESDAEISRLMTSSRAMTPELTAALRHSGNVVAECQQRMVEYFFAVAREMPPASGRRYLTLMVPVAQYPGPSGVKSPRGLTPWGGATVSYLRPSR